MAVGALVCMSRRDIPVCPGDVIICRWSCAEPGSGLFAAIFSCMMSLPALIGSARCPLAEEIEAYIYVKVVRPNALRTWPWSFCRSRNTVLLCAKSDYLQTHIYVFTTRIIARLTAITAILSRMCRQVWIGTFGICRLQARAPIPMQTNTLGTSRCTDGYIRHMQTSAPCV